MVSITINYEEATLFAVLLKDNISITKRRLYKKIHAYSPDQWEHEALLISNKEAMLKKLNEQLSKLIKI